jgi:hypothetical protein
MDKPQCEACRYFASAYTCIEKPTWGHCTWSGHGDHGDLQGTGLFTWADDCCINYRARQEQPASQ